MLELSNYLHNAGLLLVLLAMVANIVAIGTRARLRRTSNTPELVLAGGRSGPGAAELPHDEAPSESAAGGPIPLTHQRGLGWYGDRLAELAFVALTLGLVLRSVVTGHAPFANQFEFATSFAWGILLCYIWFEWRYQIRGLALLVLPITFGMLLYASNLSRAADPLIPALQNSLLLTLHVFAAVVAYGAAAVSFAAAVLVLLRLRIHWRGFPTGEVLEEVGYRAVVLAFPMLTMMLILGALWADIAWGRYWSWDPKETSALVTWLIYGAYLHARVMAGWRGSKAAWLLVLGFAAVIFTFTGNHWFGGMHSYV